MAVTQAERLAQWRAATQQAFVSEFDLLRDMLFVLQGIDGHHVRFLPPAHQSNGTESGIHVLETPVGPSHA
jgi:hypothetical protein